MKYTTESWMAEFRKNNPEWAARERAINEQREREFYEALISMLPEEQPKYPMENVDPITPSCKEIGFGLGQLDVFMVQDPINIGFQYKSDKPKFDWDLFWCILIWVAIIAFFVCCFIWVWLIFAVLCLIGLVNIFK
jgi:hypothetical protein